MDTRWDALCAAINAGDVSTGVAEATRLADSGETPLAIFLEGIEPCLTDIGDRFGRLEIFLPELMMAAGVVKGIQEVLLPRMQEDAGGESLIRGRIVIGTIFGDIHDIGKSIVSVLLQVNGYEVRDLGVAVPAAKLCEEAEGFEADIIGISGLMMPSLPYMRDAIALVKENPALAGRFRVMVGGGPVTREWAEAAGADGYADDAVTAVQEANRLMALAREGG
ncbi:MAG: cobalamin-dependent protein [Actinomycetota bacterium]